MHEESNENGQDADINKSENYYSVFEILKEAELTQDELDSLMNILSTLVDGAELREKVFSVLPDSEPDAPVKLDATDRPRT